MQPVRIEVTNPIYDDLPYRPTRFINVPCGRCPLCMSRKKNEWMFRLKQTAKYSTDCRFVTFTYNDENLPGPHQNGKSNVQCFIKRFRKNNGLLGTDFKYYLIAELGGELGRLHYHAIFFNTGMTWRQLYNSVERDWGKGFVKIQTVNKNRLHYVAKAHMQNINRPKAYRERFVDYKGRTIYRVVRPCNYFFMCCSKGIGIEFLSEAMINYIRSTGDLAIHENGFTSALPRYYYLKIYDDGEDLFIELKKQRLIKAIEDYENEQKISMGYTSQCADASRRGCRPPSEPISWQERKQKAERITKKMKKYKFVEPPPETWFRKKKK